MYTPVETVNPSVALWICGKNRDIPGLSGWNGFIEDVIRCILYKLTFVTYQPFINASPRAPSDYDYNMTYVHLLKSNLTKRKQYVL